MKITDLAGKQVCILGFGREGQAMLRALETHCKNCDITIADKDPILPTTHYPLLTGPDYLQHLSRFDIVIKTPGIPPQPEFREAQVMTSSTQIFLDSIRNSGAIMIGVTGSKGNLANKVCAREERSSIRINLRQNRSGKRYCGKGKVLWFSPFHNTFSN